MRLTIMVSVEVESLDPDIENTKEALVKAIVEETAARWTMETVDGYKMGVVSARTMGHHQDGTERSAGA